MTTTFCCKSCMRFKPVEQSAELHKPIQRRTCIACSTKIAAAARRNLTKPRPARYRTMTDWAATV
jgi:hypothetical protein